MSSSLHCIVLIVAVLTDRYKHQKQALYWLERREAEPTYEDTPDNPCLWRTRQKGGQTVYYNLITNQETKIEPDESRGGILADDVRNQCCAI
jgi:hypothetical protein